MKKTDHERLQKIITTWSKVKAQIHEKKLSKEQLLTDEYVQWAMTTPPYNIGEQVYQLSDEIKKAHPEIPWRMVSGLRHRLVHDYDGVNWEIIADVVFDEMDLFARQIQELAEGSEMN